MISAWLVRCITSSSSLNHSVAHCACSPSQYGNRTPHGSSTCIIPTVAYCCHAAAHLYLRCYWFVAEFLFLTMQSCGYGPFITFVVFKQVLWGERSDGLVGIIPVTQLFSIHPKRHVMCSGDTSCTRARCARRRRSSGATHLQWFLMKGL